jgi:hypothetical protein
MTMVVDCKEEINFVCTLADESHGDVCATRCIKPNGRDLCTTEKPVRKNMNYLSKKL